MLTVILLQKMSCESYELFVNYALLLIYYTPSRLMRMWILYRMWAIPDLLWDGL